MAEGKYIPDGALRMEALSKALELELEREEVGSADDVVSSATKFFDFLVNIEK